MKTPLAFAILLSCLGVQVSARVGLAADASDPAAPPPVPVDTTPVETAPPSATPLPAPSPPPASTAPASIPAAAQSPPSRPPTASVNTAPASTPRREPQFGDRGEWVISGELSASLGRLWYTGSDVGVTAASLQPAFDYFFGPNISLGAAGLIKYSNSNLGAGFRTTTTDYGIAVRLGGNSWLGKAVSFRPVASFQFQVEHSTFELATPSRSVFSRPQIADSSGTTFLIELFTPLLVHPANHLFVGLGPDGFFDLENPSVDGHEEPRIFGEVHR
jgi:hypothetical protein